MAQTAPEPTAPEKDVTPDPPHAEVDLNEAIPQLKRVRFLVDVGILFILTTLITRAEPALGKWNRELVHAMSALQVAVVVGYFFQTFGGLWQFLSSHGPSSIVYIVLCIPICVVLALSAALLYTVTLGPLGPVVAVAAAVVAIAITIATAKTMSSDPGVFGWIWMAIIGTVSAFLVFLVFVVVGQLLIAVLTLTDNLIQWVASISVGGFFYISDAYKVFEEKTKDWIDRRLAHWIVRNWVQPALVRRT